MLSNIYLRKCSLLLLFYPESSKKLLKETFFSDVNQVVMLLNLGCIVGPAILYILNMSGSFSSHLRSYTRQF